MVTIAAAKSRLDLLITKARVDLYKPIQIAEVLYRSRTSNDINTSDINTFKNPSIHWRDIITLRLANKRCTSSAKYQHDIWSDTAMPLYILEVLDEENKRTNGAVERYIYRRYAERQDTVAAMITLLSSTTPELFYLETLLEKFTQDPGLRRSIDKAYEIVSYALFETIVTELKATVEVSIPESHNDLLNEFKDIARVILGLDNTTSWKRDAHIYRVGVTNAADRGLDMWANFGPALQVKHMTLDSNLAIQVVDQVESDSVVIVCKDADLEVIRVITSQIGWGRRIQGYVTEGDLITWYERCLRGKYSSTLGEPLLNRLRLEFPKEFPQISEVLPFLDERGYSTPNNVDLWNV